MRKAEFLRDRLNAPGEKIFVPDRTSLAVIWKHPVFVLRLRPLLQGQQPSDVGLRQPDGAIGAVVLRGVELALIDGTHHPQVPGFRNQILPLECQFVRTDAKPQQTR